ncbi:universal stress protein [Streptomyces paradoxus]|uniref:universal stress protein n=1 Tax=Streptomyces paradoxus TaxID=66375 RepID=UPI00382E3D6A
MSPMSPVLVGFDGRPESVAAAGWAAREALMRGAPLRLVHAWEQAPRPYATPAGAAVQQHPHGSTRLLADMEALLIRRHPGLRIAAARVAGEPATALLTAAADAGMLVLGSRGLGRAAGFLLGSVGRSVVARAERPVVLVRADATLDAASADHGASVRDVVVGVDLDQPDDSVLVFALEAAARRGAGLRVVHSWDPAVENTSAAGLPGVDDPAAERTMAARQPLAELLRPWQDKFPDLSVTEQTVVGQAASHLVDASRDAELLVVGRASRHAPIRPQIGPVTRAVLQHAVPPVAVIPHD